MKKILKVAAVFAIAALVSSQAFAKKANGSAEAGNTEVTENGEAPAKAKKEKKSKKQIEAELAENLKNAFAEGDYDTCLSIIKSKKDKKANALLNELDTDMLLHLKGDFLGSGKALLATQGSMQQSKKDTAGGKKAGAAMSSETATKYTGNIYERILMYTMRAVNALSMGDIGNAKGVMDTYTGDYKDLIAPLIAEQKALAEESEPSAEEEAELNSSRDKLSSIGLSVDVAAMNSKKPPKSTKLYETSPFLSYLGTVIYAANGDAGHANDFASALKKDNPSIDVSEDVAVPAGKGRIDVVALSGTIGKRSEKANEFAAGAVGSIPIKFKIAYPAFEPQKQSHAVTAVRVTLNDGTAKTTTVIEDFDEAVKIDVDLKARSAYNRSVFRNIMKTSIVIPTLAASLEAVQGMLSGGDNPLAQILYNKTAEGIRKAADGLIEAERADLRQCSYFPHKASVAGFTVAPGTYSAKVDYLSGNTVVATKNLENIVVEAGKPTVVVSSCAK